MLYTAVIRSAVAYGAAAYHVPAAPKPRGIARSLAREQNKCRRVVAGAFRATQVRNLETETFDPPIDLYLKVRLADFEAWLADWESAAYRQRVRRRTSAAPPKAGSPTQEVADDPGRGREVAVGQGTDVGRHSQRPL